MSRPPRIRLQPVELAMYAEMLLALQRAREEVTSCIAGQEQRIADEMRAKGATWQDLGDIYGVSPQAALRRFAKGEALPSSDGG